MYGQVIYLIQLIFQAAGIVVLFTSSITATVQYFLLQPWQTHKDVLQQIESARVAFGQKIVFGLEFFIVADAIATVTKPSLDELYRLAVIVAIRTALSFFISREMYIMHDRIERKGRYAR